MAKRLLRGVFAAAPDISDRDPGRDLAGITALLAAIPDAVVAIDKDDRIATFNDAAKASFPALTAGVSVANHLRSPDVLDAIGRARGSRGPARASWLERAPVERLFEISAAAVDRPDQASLVVVHLREISETRRFERMRVEFIANASHELRTPLASLLGFIETLQGPARNDDKARARFLSIMRDQAQRMARLIDDLLSLSRIEQHAHVRPRDRVDMAALLRHIADTLTPLAADSDATVVVSADHALTVAGDRDELMRVAENLIENAIKYGAADASDRRVLVDARATTAEAMISVRDFGHGIAPEHLPRLTERFYRVDAGQSRLKGGTGLGLALVKHVVARHRGRLTIESEPGAGSTFRIWLPLHDGRQHEGRRLDERRLDEQRHDGPPVS